ncbi:uncharacterized protein M421DRAFT_105 [Didymella exigua CBS 183.55]|uniref:DUF7587 domain-containing protein n=1 Tax=Didymella exigua CBS 183.55 TaxID=1150837 RepID=A0A6A5S3B1_9PLEO|nr:uncharacterized protein M421DRAFT_105 [Didymella exigua CBS 183.55]KAF1933924.1 hypothetical protein M421DRAFT_105 [Didymella exigua CBS 183.55]
MRSKADWQLAEPGVMLYMPATRVNIEDTKHLLSQLGVTADASHETNQSQASNVSDTILPSCESLHGDWVQQEPEPIETARIDFARDYSPATLAGTDDEELFVDVESATRLLTPVSSVSPDIVLQLIEAAESASTLSNEPCIATTTDSTEDFLDICYDSERTDFQESPSPTIRKAKKVTKCATGAVSRHFKAKARSSATQPPIRRPDFGNRLDCKKQATKKPKSAYAQSLQDLADIESPPPHNWDDNERELLCILNRWYCGQDRTEELRIFAKIFNSITKLDIPSKRVRAQFENHLRLYGEEAYPVFSRVFSVPFNDPEDSYAELRALVEAEATALNLDLKQRQGDSIVRSGTAKFAKSLKTRTYYQFLVQRVSEEEEWQANQVAMTGNRIEAPPSLTTMSMAVSMPSEEDWKILTDFEQSPTLKVPEPPPLRPHLTFRVWDAKNRTKFIDGSFVAQAFFENDWPRPFPAPIALDDPSEVGKILTVLHLSKEGDTPVYISTAASLLQALSYAMSMQRPQLALIDLDAPGLQQTNKLHHAANVFPWLKSQGLARWARYKGHGEHLVWADIPSDAVLHVLNLENLIRELNSDTDCHDLMHFNAFTSAAKTNTIASTLRENNVLLNTTTARALGKTAKAFGLNLGNFTLEHLQDFVARILDGWTISKPDNMDIHTMSSLAATFATALGPHAGGFNLQAVMAAFQEGVDQGTRCIAHWSRSRTGSRRKRFRSA